MTAPKPVASGTGSPFGSAPAAILAGIRIIDCTIGLAGPEATHLLAEVGAEVIKVEPPEGDLIRGSAAFATWNRSKKGVVLDLRDPQGLERLHELLATADVFVHGFRPSEAAARGLDDASLQARYPRLIVCAITGYPNGHPDGERPGWDILVQARSGAMAEVDGSRPGPIFLRFPLPSWATVYLAVLGILSRLIVRERTGKAGPCHTSLYQGTMAVLAMLWNRGENIPQLMLQKIPLPKGSPGPARLMFCCQDGLWIQVVTGFYGHPLVIETVAVLGYDFIEIEYGIPSPEQVEIYKEAFAQHPRDTWLQAFYEGDVPAAPVSPLGTLFTDEQAILNDYVIERDDRDWGRVRQTLAPYQIEPAPVVTSSAPHLGEHTEEIFAALERLAPAAGDGTAAYPTRGLLQGLKVVDFGMFLAGPLGPMFLADLGAEVIKVEALTGDRMRNPQQMVLFVGCQRGKRSIAVDLQNPASKPVLDALLRWADVVHHNQRMPAARKLGFDYESAKAANPDVVYCHVSSYGRHGPKADWPGYDPIGQAFSGWPVESAPPGQKPMWYRFGMMDHQSAMASTVPTLLALFHRERGGGGQAVASGLVAGAAETNSETMLLLDSGRLAPYAKLDDNQSQLSPGYGIYECADGRWVAVAAVGDRPMAALRATLGVDADSGLVDAFAGRSSDGVLAALATADVPAELVREDWEQGFFDQETDQPSRIAVAYPHPEFGRFEQPGAFWNLGDLDLTLDLPPPLLGQHSTEILRTLGFDDEEIRSLLDSGVVTVPVAPMVPVNSGV